MRSVICFLNAKNMRPAEIHRQLFDVYGEPAMSSLVVRGCVQLFNEDVNMCMMMCRVADRLVNEDLMRTVEEKIRENRRFTIMSPCISSNFVVTLRNCV